MLWCGEGGGGGEEGRGGVGEYFSDIVIKRAKLTISFWYIAYFPNDL